MKYQTIFGALAICSLALANNRAMAAITPPTLPAIIDFNALALSSVAGNSNVASPDATTGACPTGPGKNCYQEDGFLTGVVIDNTPSPEAAGAHLHRFIASATDKRLQYHADSTGIYIRAKDSSAFSLSSMDFFAPINSENPIYGNDPAIDEFGMPIPISDIPADIGLLGSDEYWEILGFNTAENPTLADAPNDGTNYSSRIAYQTVANGFDGTLSLNSDFGNINAFWIHYHGYPRVPTNGISFGMQLDNVHVAAPVPVPAAMWLFVSGLAGFQMLGKRRIRASASA